ncbi:uncharacterized protein LOC109716523 [Ananas comosus]|uniref:Uncharacterized protein LOC109716523 n=1 Tax=Ananas comosus TaxID=4615 RepID=A0A6P5FNP2_ANACO|nr:uncharacterized protein LOC109716523 [Ananas comosus]XP_020097619.1 uncharacterized protein LOC109716523 [Ananas comosus]XP_020097621.1 uncharacterized protein LOC109716523 [Ananas comosus]
MGRTNGHSLLLLRLVTLFLFYGAHDLIVVVVVVGGEEEEPYNSAVGDPGMRRDGLRVAWEAWNFCNEVGAEAPLMGSPRGADCFDLLQDESGGSGDKVVHRVSEKDNKLSVGDPFSGEEEEKESITNVDLYAAAKEVYLGKKCEVDDDPPWQFWMIMLKNGNLDTTAALCPENGKKVGPFRPQPGRFPCFGSGCMNQPLVYHNYTALDGDKLSGGLFGTYDLDAADLEAQNVSYYAVTWEKEVGKGGWVFHHVLRTTRKYPWLMLYLRSDATQGFSGGYHYQTRGMTTIVPESPNFKVRLTLDIKKGGGAKSQFYLLDMGSCWKNSGAPCDGDVTTDVTRYSEMIINPEAEAWCRPDRLDECPPYHTFRNGTRVHRTDTARFPHAAYHVYCSPGNAEHAERPTTFCDPYSNPQPQEILQILPHPVWGEYGYPTEKGEGWIGDPRTWELDVGAMSQSLYFYQDPGTPAAKRRWTSIDVGTEIYVSEDAVAEWTLSDFDILISKRCEKSHVSLI